MTCRTDATPQRPPRGPRHARQDCGKPEPPPRAQSDGPPLASREGGWGGWRLRGRLLDDGDGDGPD